MKRTLTGLTLALALTLPAGRALADTTGGSVGSLAPDFSLQNVLNPAETFTLQQYRGSVVVIAFFAWW